MATINHNQGYKGYFRVFSWDQLATIRVLKSWWFERCVRSPPISWHRLLWWSKFGICLSNGLPNWCKPFLPSSNQKWQWKTLENPRNKYFNGKFIDQWGAMFTNSAVVRGGTSYMSCRLWDLQRFSICLLHLPRSPSFCCWTNDTLSIWEWQTEPKLNNMYIYIYTYIHIHKSIPYKN